MDACLGRSKVLGTQPVAYLVCNGSPPLEGQPSLMTFREVETLFHGIYAYLYVYLYLYHIKS